MKSESGFYLMHRGWLDHPVLRPRGEPWDRASAWCWLIENARWATGDVFVGGRMLTVSRGELCYSLRFLAAAWNWPEPRVRRYLGTLAKVNMIRRRIDAGQTVVTICNYEIYQSTDGIPDAVTDAASTQHRRSTDANKKEGNKGIREEEERDSPSLVENGPPTQGQPDLLDNVIPLPDPVPAAVEMWNAMASAHGLSTVQKLTQPRRASLAARLKECGGIEGWKHALDLVSTSSFLLGKVNDFKADFDFIILPKRFVKLMEGGYNNRGSSRGAPGPDERIAIIQASRERRQ